MHRALAAWMTERPWRAAFASAICGALSPQMLLPFMIFAGAIPVLMSLRFDLRIALAIALTGGACATWVVLSVTEPNVWIFVAIGCLFLSPLTLAALLKRTGSMNLSFQVAVLGAALAVLAVHLIMSDPVAIWVPLLRRVIESMISAGLHLEGEREAIIQLWARTMWGALAALSLATVLGGLFLGRWWDSLLRSPGAFGEEYRRLRLGFVLGVLVSILFVLALVSDAPLISSLAWVGFSALAFQGLAAAHRSKARGSLNRGWLAAIYVLLIVPLSMSVTVFVLALWGFADNWLRPRAQQV